MTQTRDLLIELGTEELPPKALPRLSDAFVSALGQGLEKAELSHGALRGFAAPRRLAVLIEDLAERQPDKEIERRGPALNAAFDGEGKPTKAAEGFARSCGVAVAELDTVDTDKGAWLGYRAMREGAAATALIAPLVEAALEQLPIPKRMRWGALEAQFVRPVHWLVLLFGDEIIDAELLAMRSGRETRGHRFHHPAAMYVGSPRDYEELLYSEGHVIADFGRRRRAVHGQVEEAAAGLGASAVIDPALLDEVTGMVEWPQAVVGSFDERFLDVPSEALVSAMKNHQKYFHLVDESGRLLPNFITISNIESREPQAVRAGNERVIRPRLADAQFFWNQDRRRPLAARREALRKVVFQKRLGTLHEKVERVARLSESIAASLAGDRQWALRAAELCKCDLMTEMVGEFPELQGTMGRYYAAHDREPAEVATAIQEHYLPRFAGDALPATKTGQAVALADRLDTLVGIFAIGQVPSGEKDPFALRRAAIGVLRILIEQELELDLAALIRESAAHFPADLGAPSVADDVLGFVLERLRTYYAERELAQDAVDAVLATAPTRPLDIDRRVRAVARFSALPAAESLAAANKRIANILKKVSGPLPETVDESRLEERAERALFEAVMQAQARVRPLFAQGRYAEALETLAGLRDTVDGFFDAVLVMAEDEQVRSNRIGLLNRLRDLFLQVADISRLQH